MPFPFYARLSPRGKAIYRRSDELEVPPLPRPLEARPLLAAVERALETEDRRKVLAASTALLDNLAEQLGVPPVKVRVLSVRPSSRTAELHGLYERESGETPTIRVWMRTAVHQRCVSFRTFARTLLHELGHHLDYELFRLLDSYHTEGFFRREAALFRQITGEQRRGRRPGAGKKATAKKPVGGKKAEQRTQPPKAKPTRRRRPPDTKVAKDDAPRRARPPKKPPAPEAPSPADNEPTPPNPAPAPTTQLGLPFD